MTKKKWGIVIGLGVAACMAALAIIVIVWFFGLGNILWSLGLTGVNGSLPVYTTEQVLSSHPGYRRSTATSGTNVYVCDFEEQMLHLQNYDPTDVIGRFSFGN